MPTTRRELLAALAAGLAPGNQSQLTASTACLAGFTFDDSLRKIAELGFGGVEILAFTGQKHSIGPIPGAVVSELTPEERRRCRRLVERFRFVTTHLPFHDLRPADARADIRERSQALIRRAIEDSGFWGASVATIHVAPEKDYRAVWPTLLSVHRAFGDLAAKHKVKIGIETGTPNTVPDYLDLIREINHPHIGGTIDTGHTRAHRSEAGLADSELGAPRVAQIYNDLLMRKVEGLGARLIHFHFDDVRAGDWREHRTLGKGIVDWPRLMAYLRRHGYQGAFALELEESPVVDALVESRDFYARLIG